MLTSAQIFSVANLIAMLCWVALAISLFASRIRVWTLRVTGLIVPAIFAVVFVFCFLYGLAGTPGGGSAP
jgi:membrane protein DedA with SNARE-associated domain